MRRRKQINAIDAETMVAASVVSKAHADGIREAFLEAALILADAACRHRISSNSTRAMNNNYRAGYHAACAEFRDIIQAKSKE